MALTLEQARQNALNRRKSITPQTAQQNITAEESKSENTGGLLGGVGYTLGRVGLGALRGLEGILDFAVGGIADLFGADEWAYEQATESPFDDLTTELDAWYNPSEFMQFVGDVGAGVGQMLPSVAVAAIPGAGPALSTAMFTTSAAGMGVSDAAKTTGELGAKEWLYGGASGAVEGAIEKLSGGIGGTKLGTVLGKQVAKSTAGKVASTFVGEGLEEVASDLIDPALRRVTGVDPDATVDVSQLPNTFLVGGTAGAVLGGGSRLVNARRAGGFNNLNAAEDANAIREARARGNTLQAEGRLTDKWVDTLSKSEQEAAQRLSTRLQRMNADTRAQFIEQNNLGDLYDVNGVLAENTAAKPQEYNRDAISYSARNLVGRTDADGNSVLKYAPTKNAVREDIAQAAKDIAKLSNGDSRYVVVDTLTVPESGQKANAFYDNETGIMYIANDADASDARSFVVSHEYVHSLEGSGQYSRYANEVLSEIARSPEYRKKYNYDEYYARYKWAHPNVQEETLNYIVETEMVADFTAKEILTNESAIRRLVNRDASLVRRIYEWVKEKIRQLPMGGGSRESVAYLRKAERLLAKALDHPGGGIGVSEMDKYVREEKARRDAKEKDAEAEPAEVGEAHRSSASNDTITATRYSLAKTEQEAVDLFGHTYKWAETGYVLPDGSRLDFSGRHEGARGGNRTVDHRDIAQIEAYEELSGNDAMIDFMKRGNIRIKPEVNGINLSVRPTKAQENTLSDFISRERGEITLDIDNENGDIVVSVEYPRGTHANKILQDIRNYFENGTKPTVSEIQQFRYSLPETDFSQNQNTRDENYINNKLKTYTYADVESIVDNLTINKYGDDVVLRGKKNVGKQIYTLLNETPIRNRRAKAEQIARQIVYQDLAAQSLYNAEEIENARKDGIEISETWIDKKLSSQLSETENESLVKEIRDELLNSFETAGKLNATGKMYLRYKEVGDRLSKLLVKDSILKTARRMKKRNYPKAFEAFDGIRKILAKLEMRSDINEKSGREIIKAFGEFYTASNEALQGYYSEEVRQAIDDFISYNGEGNLDLYELEQIDTILNAADHLLKEYDKAFLNGRTVSVTKTSSKAVNTVKENADLYKATVLGAMRLKGYVGSFFRSIVDTRTLAMWLDGGNKGIITELFDDIAKASTRQTITVMDLYDDFDKFIKKNKKFYKSLEQKVTFKFNGKDVEITRGEAISLYLTSLQEDGLYHLAFGGFAVGKDKNNIRRYVGQKPLYGTPEDVEQYESEVMQQAKKEFSALYDTFTETEKEYIRLARDLFNNKAKRIKQEIDIQRIGMTNANVENYFPERVYEVGRPLKQGNTYIQEMNLIANQSIHKDRVKGSKQTLYISPVNMVVMNHIRQIAMYNAYAIPIDTLRRVMNKNVSLTFDGKPNTAQAETLKTVIQETAWADFEKFLDKYMMDVQGGSFSNTTPDKIIRWMRSNYAKFQLGLNIKTMLSQLTSLPMAGSRLGWKNLLKGTFAKPNFEEMLKYSEWARARNYEGAAYKSQSLVDNVDKVGQLAMKPIGMVDLFTMNRIYNAAKYYIASRDGVSLDSVECKTKAAAMLEEIGRETQNNSEAAEKSSLMRSGNELIKSIVMFSSDAMKQFSTLVQSLNKIKFIKQKIKLGKGDKATLEKQLSSARKEACGAFASVGASSAMYVLMGMLVNYGLFAKEPEDDESYIEIFLKNFGGSVTGMIPVVRDLYSFFVEGYELDNFAYETVNGLSEAVKNIGTLMERAGSGERVTDQEWMLAMRKFIYAAGQITGLPTRNLYNQIYGLIKRVSPSAAYDINSIFYGASTKDLDKAIQKGDTALSTTIAEQLLSDKGIDASKEVASVFSDLYSKGYSMPKGIPESITYNEEEISLNAKQQGIVIDAYSEAANKAEGLINSADWESLSDDAKANALKLLFNYYYYYGINKATGAYADNRTLLLGSAIDITKIASAYGKIAELTADTDKKGNVISGTKKAKVQRLVNSLRLSAAQKYILMGFLGYKNSNGESSVTSYIRNIGISQDMQTALFEMSGYEVS